MEKNIISRVISKFRPINAVLDTSVLEAGWHTVNSTVNHYADDMYENGYSSIRAIANRYMTLVPYAIDDNGKPLTTPPNVIQALSRPNQDMSGVDFRDALAVMTMVHDNVYVLVHEKFGRTTRPAREGIREDQIAGFTFLENAIEVSIDGKIQYEVYKSRSKDVYYPYQVLDLHDVNPKNLSKGYSPSRAARRWTKIDDYIADYQGGFFENGAVPAGQFIITAPTAQEYKNIVRNLKKKHRGAGQNNNVTYTYAPIDPVSGKPGQAAITWVPFNTTNKDLSLQELFNQANKKIDSVYGVSAFIRAIDEAPNFATAQVIERNFVENTVRPFAIKKWGRIQHELNRITGGLGYGISFKLETPHIAEEQKSTAETDLVIWNTIKDIIASGFTYDSAVNTLKLPPNWALLEEGENKTTTINNPKTDVGEGSDVPANKLKKKTKAKQPKAELTDQERIENATTKFMRSQVDNAIEQYSESVKNSIKMQDPTQAEIDAYITEMMAIITGILAAYGIEGYAEGALIADLTVGELNGYNLTETAKNAYKTYLKKVAESYGADTSDSIRKVLSEANLNGLTRVETEKALKGIMDTDDWRVKRLARTELNNSQNVGKLEGMKAMAAEAGGRWEKTINHQNGGGCPLCRSQEGVWTVLDVPLWGLGDEISAINDKGDKVIYVNNWQDNQANGYHPNCKGALVFRRASDQDLAPEEPVYEGVDGTVEAGEYIKKNWGDVQYTEEQSRKIQSYASDDFRGINKYLRTGSSELDDVDSYVTAMDGAFGKAQLKTDTILRRGMQLPDKFELGQIYTDKGYVSTTISKNIRDTFVGASEASKKVGSKVYSVEINASKGQNILLPDVARGKYILSEGEMILPRGSKFIIDTIGDEVDGVINLGMRLL